MKKFKLMALAMTVSMIATSIVSAVSVNAEDVLVGKDTVNSGFDLVYNKAKSSETVRYIDIYAKGATEEVNYIGINISVTVEDNVIKNEPNSDPTDNWQTGFQKLDAKYRDKSGIRAVVITNNNPDVDNMVYFGGSYVGSLAMNVADASSTFKLTLNNTKCALKNNTASFTIEAETLEVPAFATEPVKPELPAFDEELTATAIEGLFDDDTTTVPVKAWMTDAVDWSSYDAVKALNWIITVNGVEQAPVAATSETEITGGMTVIYGLAIAGQADELETIESVVLK